MIEISRRNIKTWARMGSRALYGQALSNLAAEDPNIIAISADLGRSSGLARFSKSHPEQFINSGIAEQNMIGLAAGLARTGYDVFASTFAPFASMRAAEQVRMNMGYMKEPVRLVALGSGLSMGFLGNSHYGLEDVAVMRTIPGLTIVSPADCSEIVKTLKAAVDFRQPMYIRLTGGVNMPVVYEEDYEFEIGSAIWIEDPKEINIVSSGTTVGHCKKAIELLRDEGVGVGLLNMHTIKPLDENALTTCLEKSKVLIVVEEHTVIGGLGSAVLDWITSHRYQGLFYSHGIQDKFVETGDYPFLLESNRLDARGISMYVKDCLSQ